MKKISAILVSVFICFQAHCQERFLPNLIKNWDIAGNLIASAIIRENSVYANETENYWPTHFIDWSKSPDVSEPEEYLAFYEPGKEQVAKESFYLIPTQSVVVDYSRSWKNYIRAKNGSSYCPLFQYSSHKELLRSSDYIFWVVCEEGKFIEISTELLTQSDVLLGKAIPDPKDIWHIEYNDYGAPVLIWRDNIRYSFSWNGNNVVVEARWPDYIDIRKYVFAQSSEATACFDVKEYKFDAIDEEFILIGTHLSNAGNQKVEQEKIRKQEGEKQELEKINGIPFSDIEVKPLFKGKDINSFSLWVNKQLKYPDIAKENGIEGKVMLQFTIDTDGSVRDIKVLRGIDPALDREAVRVVSSSPKWEPGISQGETVKTTITFPVIFHLR